METPIIENRITYEQEHFCRKLVSILNVLNNDETAEYKIGYKNYIFTMLRSTIDQGKNYITKIKSSFCVHTPHRPTPFIRIPFSTFSAS